MLHFSAVPFRFIIDGAAAEREEKTLDPLASAAASLVLGSAAAASGRYEDEGAGDEEAGTKFPITERQVDMPRIWKSGERETKSQRPAGRFRFSTTHWVG